MLEHLSVEQIERYRRRAMPPAELLAADDHLAACDACRQHLSELGQLPDAFASLQADLQASASTEPVHLPYEQLAAYMDDTLNEADREIVESHMELCRQCAKEADDLRLLIATMKAGPAKEYSPPSLWEKFLALWRWPAHWTPLQLASAATAVVLIVTASIAGLFVWRSTRSEGSLAGPARLGGRQDNKPTGTTLVVALNDGGERVTLDSLGNLSGLESLPPSYREKVKTTLMAQKVDTPAMLAGLIGKAGTLMSGFGEGVSFNLLSPVGTVVRTRRPTFRWKPLSGATSYIVKVYDANFNEADGSPSLSGTEWKATRSLKRGGVYTWQVTARKESKEIISPTPPAPAAKFKVLEQAKVGEMEHAKQVYAGSHLILGILYAQAGLLDDAERELQALLDANSQSSAVRKLLHSVQALRLPK